MVIERDSDGLPTALSFGAGEIARKALHSSATPEWYTPAWITDAARAVMGSIDLDPASCQEANRSIRAMVHYNVADDGMRQPWRGNVWLNPPYGKDGGESLQARWSSRLIEEHRLGNVEQACMLVNAVPGNRWFDPLWQFPICFLRGRVHFVAPAASGVKNQPTHSSCVVYMGPNADRFADVFCAFGHVVFPSQVAHDRSRQPSLLGEDRP